jgi:hypothetical protein
MNNDVSDNVTLSWSSPQTLFSNFIRIMFPRTQSSLSDLDQIVPALGGATILAFNLLSAARCWYTKKRDRDRRAAELKRRNDNRM